MTKAIFLADFSHSLPVLPDDDGRDRIQNASRLGPVPLNGVPTNLLVIEAPADAIADLEAGGMLLVEIVGEEL